MCVYFFFKQKTAYEMRISDWSSDVCSSACLPVVTGKLIGISGMVESAIVIGLPAPLLMTIIALAPDNIANCSLAVNEQTPRSISAILPSRRREGTTGTDGFPTRPGGAGTVRVSWKHSVAGALPSRPHNTHPT